MTSQGTPQSRFQRAVQRGRLFDAWLAAREAGLAAGFGAAGSLHTSFVVTYRQRSVAYARARAK